MPEFWRLLGTAMVSLIVFFLGFLIGAWASARNRR